MPCSSAARMVEMDSASSVPPHIHPPMAQVPRVTGDTLSEVPGISRSSIFISAVLAWRAMVFTPCFKRGRASLAWCRQGLEVGDQVLAVGAARNADEHC